MNQARLLEEHLDVKMVFFLDVPDRATLVARVRDRALHESRFEEANAAAIQQRLAVFDDTSRPLLEFYPPGLVKRIDATDTAAVVMEKILRALVESDESTGYAQLRHAGEFN